MGAGSGWRWFSHMEVELTGPIPSKLCSHRSDGCTTERTRSAIRPPRVSRGPSKMSRRKGGTLSNRYHSNGYVTQPTHPKKTALPPIATDDPENSHKKRPPKGSLQKLERFLCLHGRYRAQVRERSEERREGKEWDSTGR